MMKKSRLLKYHNVQRRVLTLALLVFFTEVQANSLSSNEWSRLTTPLIYEVPATDVPNEYELEQNPSHDNGRVGDDATDQKSKRYEKERSVPPKSVDEQSDVSWLNALIYFILGGLFLFLVVQLLRRISRHRNGQQPLRTDIDVNNPEELVELELVTALKKALHAEDYNLCIRYLFLLMLEQLQRMELIRWQKHLTNGEYMLQLTNFIDVLLVRRLTHIYEFYWYGEHVLNRSRFEQVMADFKSLTNSWKDE